MGVCGRSDTHFVHESASMLYEGVEAMEDGARLAYDERTHVVRCVGVGNLRVSRIHFQFTHLVIHHKCS